MDQCARKRIIFVDDEPAMLDLFRLMLKPMEEQWDLDYAASGVEALEKMNGRPAEVVVTDMHMAGMSGVQLLNEVMQRHPRTARLILSGYAEQESVAKCVGAAHQYLMKPCDLATLRNTLTRVCALDVFLQNEHLKGLVSKMTVLPSLPTIYFKVLKELQSPDTSAERVGDLVGMDPAMTAKLLQLVNSAFFGVARKVSNPVEAVQMLGINTVRSLAVSIHAFSCFDQHPMRECSLEGIWNHSLVVGHLSRRIAQLEGADMALMDEAFISGLLHDLGKLMLACNLPGEYKSAVRMAREAPMPLSSAEREVFGATHSDVGAYLIGLWGLPVTIVEAVALHHQPLQNADRTFTPLTAVHAANALDHELDEREAGEVARVDRAYMAELGLEDRFDGWRLELAEMRQRTETALS